MIDLAGAASERNLNFYYGNTPMQYTAILHVCKNVHFQMIF